jgi:hypothetical protein
MENDPMGRQRLILKPLAQRLSCQCLGIIGNTKAKRNNIFFHRAVLGTRNKGAALPLTKNTLALTSRSLTHCRLGGRAAIVKRDQSWVKVLYEDVSQADCIYGRNRVTVVVRYYGAQPYQQFIHLTTRFPINKNTYLNHLENVTEYKLVDCLSNFVMNRARYQADRQKGLQGDPVTCWPGFWAGPGRNRNSSVPPFSLPSHFSVLPRAHGQAQG